MQFGRFPAYWLESWILAFAIWLIPVAILKIIGEVREGNMLPDEPNTEEEDE